MSHGDRHFPQTADINDQRGADRALPGNSFIKSLVEELLNQRKVSDHSVYTGRLGVDILRLRYTGTVEQFQAKNSFKHQESFFTGLAGYLAVKTAATGDQSRVAKFLQIANNKPRNGWECEELLYGRAGWLAAVGFALNYRPGHHNGHSGELLPCIIQYSKFIWKHFRPPHPLVPRRSRLDFNVNSERTFGRGRTALSASVGAWPAQERRRLVPRYRRQCLLLFADVSVLGQRKVA